MANVGQDREESVSS